MLKETLMKKTLFVHLNFESLGGAELYGTTSAQALAKSGMDIFLLSSYAHASSSTISGLAHYGALPNISSTYRKIITRLGRLFGANDLWLRQALRRFSNNIDLIICGHMHCLPTVAKEAHRQNIPYWLLVYGIDVWRGWSSDEVSAIEQCPRIVTISRFTADSVETRCKNIAGKKINIIPPAVDIGFFTPSQYEINDEMLTILTVGRLSSSERYKGHDLVINALPSLAQKIRRPLEYHIVGDGDDRPRLEKLATDKGVRNMVRFHGRVSIEEMREAYRSCHIFAMPSYVSQRDDGSWTGEGFGIVYAEAASCGKPCLACDKGGQTDIVRHGVNGILVKPTVESVADGLFELLSNLDRAEEMGRTGRKIVEEEFSLEQFNRRWAEVLKESCAE